MIRDFALAWLLEMSRPLDAISADPVGLNAMVSALYFPKHSRMADICPAPAEPPSQGEISCVIHAPDIASLDLFVAFARSVQKKKPLVCMGNPSTRPEAVVSNAISKDQLFSGEKSDSTAKRRTRRDS